MDKQYFLKTLTEIYQQLLPLDTSIEQNLWDEVVQSVQQANQFNEQIAAHQDVINQWQETDMQFKDQFDKKRTEILQIIQRYTALIEEWQILQQKKFSDSRNLQKNIGHYNKQASMSYYIDKKE
jgi:predicted nuclease with TOPRIM domain